MRISVNELDILARKAAIGAGIDYGYASEAAQSLTWLYASGIDAIQGYIHALQAWSSGKTNPAVASRVNDTCTIKPAKAGSVCVLYAAPAARDFLQVINRTGHHGRIELKNVDNPLFVLAELAREQSAKPAIIRCTEPGQTTTRWATRLSNAPPDYAVHIDGDVRHASPADMLVRPDNQSDATKTRTTLTTDPDSLFRLGITIEATYYDALKAFLNLTLVPDSEESRKHGAGAGLVDSD